MEYGLFPIWSGWISQEYKPGTHKGIDVGWLSVDGANLPCRAWKSGTVIASGTDAAGAYYVVIAHENNQWSGYWHLVKDTNIAKGTKVKQGDKVGVRGNTGLSSGIHLHFLITSEGMPATYNYNTMVNNTVNPIPLCYKYKTDNIQNANNNEQYPLPIMPDVPKTVKRDTSKHQVEVLASALRIRTKPSTSADIYCIATQGLYNVLQQKDADGYVWDEIEKNRWIATNEKDGWTKDYPAESTLEKEVEELQAKIDELNEIVGTLRTNNTELNKTLNTTKKSLTSVTKERDKLTEQVSTLTTEKTTVETELKDTKTKLTSTQKSLESKTEEAAKLTTDLASKTEELTKVNDDLKTTKATLKSTKSELTSTKSELSKANSANEKLTKDLTETTTQLSLVTEEKEVVSKELTTTKDSLNTLQGHVSAVANALKNLFGV